MAATINTRSPARRALLSAGLSLAALSAAAGDGPETVPPLPASTGGIAPADARLLGLQGLAQRYAAAERAAMERGWAAERAGDAAGKASASSDQDAAFDGYAEAIEEMAALPASGALGMAAKAAAIAIFAEHATSGLNDNEAELLAGLAADAVRLLAPHHGADALVALRRTDQALIEACDAWMAAGEDLAAGSTDDLLGGLELVARRQRALAEIIDTRAATGAGRKAKALVLAKLTFGRGETIMRLAASVASDQVGGPGA